MAASVALALAISSSLLSLSVNEPPGDRPPVQQPETSEEPAPVEPAPEPGAGFEPSPMEPLEPEPEPEPEPGFEPRPMEPLGEPIDPRAGAQPPPASTPAPAPAPSAGAMSAPGPVFAPTGGGTRRERLIDAGYAPPQGSYGLIISGAGLGAFVIIKQALSVTVCRGSRVNCGEAGILDRVLLGGTGIMGAMGGWSHGKRLAYDDAATGREPRRVGARVGAGWSLFLIGAGVGAADLTMAVQCWSLKKGPYAIEDVDDNPFKIRCRSGTSMILADSATFFASLGAGLALSGHRYSGERRRYDSVLGRRMNVFPFQTPGGGGLGVAGRF